MEIIHQEIKLQLMILLINCSEKKVKDLEFSPVKVEFEHSFEGDSRGYLESKSKFSNRRELQDHLRHKFKYIILLIF